eukprot:1158346-Pelagomonas_calceolata.AAC.4
MAEHPKMLSEESRSTQTLTACMQTRKNAHPWDLCKAADGAMQALAFALTAVVTRGIRIAVWKMEVAA